MGLVVQWDWLCRVTGLLRVVQWLFSVTCCGGTSCSVGLVVQGDWFVASRSAVV